MGISYRTPPEDQTEYIARLGRLTSQAWQWHTAPAAAPERSAELTIADYCFDLAERCRKWMQKNMGIVATSRMDDHIVLTDFAFTAIEELVPVHAGKIIFPKAINEIRGYLEETVKSKQILIPAEHPQFHSYHAKEVSHFLPAEMIPLCEKMPDKKLMVPPKKYVPFVRWLFDERGRLETLLNETRPELLHPPEAAIRKFMFGFRRYVAQMLEKKPLDEQRDELIESAFNQWDKLAKDDGEFVPRLCRQLGVRNIFDTEDLRPVLNSLRALTSRPELHKKIEALCNRMILKLAADEPNDDRREMLSDTGNFWENFLDENGMPLYEHPEFGLACLAGLLRANSQEHVLLHLGAIEKNGDR